MKWFSYIVKQELKDPIAEFHITVKKYFRGSLKPPFNESARTAAGFTNEWFYIYL